MKKNYYVIRFFSNGRSTNSGFTCGTTNRFATLAEAEKNAAEFAEDVLPTSSYDYIAVGEGAVREGLSVGRGRRIAEYSVKGRELLGEIIRRDCLA